MRDHTNLRWRCSREVSEGFGVPIEKRKSAKGVVTFRVRLRLQGRKEVSSTHRRLGDARDWEANIRANATIDPSGKGIEAQLHTAKEAIDRYLKLLPSLALKDARNRQRQAEWWRRELGDTPLSAVTPTRVSRARDELQTTPINPNAAQRVRAPRYRGPATVVRYLATLSYIFTLAVDDWGWCDDNPVRKVRKPKQPRGRVRYLSEAEKTRLLKVCQASASRTLYPVVVLAIATGMRKSEILQLRWSRVDLERGLITLDQTKNGERRQLPLVGYPAEVLNNWAKSPHGELDYVFPGEEPGCPRDITKAWNTAVKVAGLADFRFHDLRHTTASYLARRGASLLEIGEVLGHKSPQSTRRYSHLSVAHTRTVLSAMVAEVFATNPTASSPAPLASA